MTRLESLQEASALLRNAQTLMVRSGLIGFGTAPIIEAIQREIAGEYRQIAGAKAYDDKSRYN